jgi:hypothetical protein
VLDVETESAALAETGADCQLYLNRHQHSDWGDVEDEVGAHSVWAIEHNGIIRSTHKLPNGVGLSLATARDRSYTHIMLETEFERREVSALEGYAQWATCFYYTLKPGAAP